MNLKRITLAGLGLGAILATGCVAPKVMVDQAFMGDQHTIKMIMQKNSAGTFDQSLRVCSIEKGAEANCKDTVVLENVTPGSLY